MWQLQGPSIFQPSGQFSRDLSSQVGGSLWVEGVAPAVSWEDLPWWEIERYVLRLQSKIFQASYRHDYLKIQWLQKRLTHSLQTKLVATRHLLVPTGEESGVRPLPPTGHPGRKPFTVKRLRRGRGWPGGIPPSSAFLSFASPMGVREGRCCVAIQQPQPSHQNKDHVWGENIYKEWIAHKIKKGWYVTSTRCLPFMDGNPIRSRDHHTAWERRPSGWGVSRPPPRLKQGVHYLLSIAFNWVLQEKGVSEEFNVQYCLNQAISQLALEPEWEGRVGGECFGFRPGKSNHDGLIFLSNSVSNRPSHLLDGHLCHRWRRRIFAPSLMSLSQHPFVVESAINYSTLQPNEALIRRMDTFFRIRKVLYELLGEKRSGVPLFGKGRRISICSHRTFRLTGKESSLPFFSEGKDCREPVLRPPVGASFNWRYGSVLAPSIATQSGINIRFEGKERGRVKPSGWLLLIASCMLHLTSSILHAASGISQFAFWIFDLGSWILHLTSYFATKKQKSRTTQQHSNRGRRCVLFCGAAEKRPRFAQKNGGEETFFYHLVAARWPVLSPILCNIALQGINEVVQGWEGGESRRRT